MPDHLRAPTAAVLLANPNAGRVDDAAIGAACAAVPSQLGLHVAITHDPQEVPAVLDRLDGRRLLVMGGDGTLNVTLGALRRRSALAGTEIGFVPAGTANAFARALELPLEPADAVRRTLCGAPRPVDLFESDAGHIAVNDLHTGLGVPATRLSARLKPVLRQASYPVANSIAGLRTAGWAIRVVVDGRPLVDRDDRVLAVMIGNTELVGDGTRMWPGARCDDGEADVVALLARPRRQRAGLALALHRGEHLGRPDVRHARGARFQLEGEVPGHNADGELAPDAGATDWTVHARAWRLWC